MKSTALVVLSKKEKQRKKLEKRLAIVQKKAAKIVKFKKQKVTIGKDGKKIYPSMFNRRMTSMQTRIDKGDVDQAILIIQKQLLKTLIDVIPIAEKGYRQYKNERAAYAFQAMVSGAREVISDIQATNDQQHLIDNIIVNILQPSFTSIAQQVVASVQHSYRSIEDFIDVRKKDIVKEELTSSAKELGRYLSDQLVFIRQRLEKDIG